MKRFRICYCSDWLRYWRMLTIHVSAPSDGLTALMQVLMSVTISLGRIAQLLYVTMPIVGARRRGSMQVMCIRYR